MTTMTQYVKAILNGSEEYDEQDPVHLVFGQYIEYFLDEDDIPENDTKEEWRKVFDFNDKEKIEEFYLGWELVDWREFENYINDKFMLEEASDMVRLTHDEAGYETPFDYFWEEIVGKEESGVEPKADTVSDLIDYLMTLPKDDKILWQVITKDFIENSHEIQMTKEQWSDFVEEETDYFMGGANEIAINDFESYREDHP